MNCMSIVKVGISLSIFRDAVCSETKFSCFRSKNNSPPMCICPEPVITISDFIFSN